MSGAAATHTSMARRSARTLLRLLLVAVALVFTGAALADGDPASDYLVARDTFTPYPPPSAQAVASLTAAVAAVDAKGDKVKVAVIATKSDLGAIPSLFGHAQEYAKYLGIELSLVYKGPLLIVMPSGFGFTDGGGRPVSAADTALARIAAGGASADGLTLTAARALPALERAAVLHYKDTLPPQVYAQLATVRAGRRVALRYQASDDSGRASVVVTIRAGTNAVARLEVKQEAVAETADYRVVWRAPLRYAHHRLTFCVQATDPSGNRSQPACAALSVTSA
jgi:hypothetical protein